MKKRIIAMLAICVLGFCQAGICEEGTQNVWERVFQAGFAELSGVSQEPTDLSGFRKIVSADRADAAGTISEDGTVCSYDLSENESRKLYFDTTPVSIGPDGAVLLYDKESPALMVQRGKELVFLAQAAHRGAEDLDGMMARSLTYRMEFIRGAAGDVRWSPDGRYLFFNEPVNLAGKHPEDPYLADTRTGEIFLLESDPAGKANPDLATGVGTGVFSKDGKSFLYEFASLTPEENYEVWKGDRYIRKYSLETGEISELYHTEASIYDFCEAGNGEILILLNRDGVLCLDRLTEDAGQTAVRTESFPGARLSGAWDQCRLLTAGENLAFIQMNYGTVLTALKPVSPDGDHPWQIIDPAAGPALKDLTLEELNARMDALEQAGAEFKTQYSPGQSYLAVVKTAGGAPYLIGQYHCAAEVTDSWDGMTEARASLIVIQAETGKIAPVIPVCYEYLRGYDQTFYGEIILNRSANGRMAPFAVVPATEPDDSIVVKWDYPCSGGMYRFDYTGDLGLPVSPQRIHTEGISLSAEISEEGSEYQIRVSILKDPEIRYMIPEAMTAERADAFKDRMGRKDWTRVSSMYRKISPEKPGRPGAEYDSMVDRCPAVKTEEMYVLKADMHNREYEAAEGIFREAGYTEEDYAIDLQAVSYSLFGGAEPELHPVTYYFTGSLSDLSGRSMKLRLATLCDRINSAVFTTYYLVKMNAGEPQYRTGEEVVQALTRDQYEVDGIVYTVTPEGTEETEDALEYSFRVTENAEASQD